MALNYQDVIRDVHDPVNHALQISGTIQAAGQATVSLLGTPTVMVGTPTLYAVVNTSAAGVGNSIVTINPRVDYIGLMSVSGNVNISNPTLYAVVNTSAAGVGNSIVTVANPDFGINAGVNSIGFATVNQVNQPALVASSANIGSVSILGGVLNTVSTVTDITNPIAIKGNVTLSDSKTFIGLTSIQGNVNLNAGIAGIGFATVNVVNQPALVASSAYIGLVTVANTVSTTFAGNITIDSGNVSLKGNVTLSDSKGFIGLTSIQGNVNLNAGINNIGFATVAVSTPTIYAVVNTTASSGLATVDIRNTINANVSLSNSLSQIGFATVYISTPTLYAVVNTGAVGVQNSIVTLASSIPAGINGIGFATVNVAALTLGTYAVDDSAMPATPQTLPISAEYRLAATTYTDGDVTVLQSDENGNLKVTLANQLAGEDLTDNLIKVGGNIVHDSADAGNPVKVGGKAASSEPSAVTAGDRVNAYFDTTGHQHVKVDAIAAGTANIGDVDVFSNTAKDGSGTRYQPLVDTDGHLQIDVLSGGGGGTQYTEADTDASITGTAMLWEDTSDTLRAVSAAKPLPVDIQDSTIAVTQSGTWDEVGINDSGNSITVDYATTGSGTATGALRVELPTNGTGVIATVGAVTAISNALPAGTNAIGKLAANTGVDIGDVDVTSVVPGTGATNLGKAEDAAHTTGDVGVMMLGVRNDSGANLSNTDGDYTPIGADITGAVRTTIFGQDDPTAYVPVIANDSSVNDGVNGLSVYVTGGNKQHDAADGGGPLKIGGKAHSSTPTAVAANDRVNAYFDLRGRQQITPAVPEQDLATEATTHVKKYYTNSGAVTDGIVWSSAAGKRWYVTDIFINVSAAATVTLEDDLTAGDAAIWKAELAANSGWSHHFGTPLFSGEDAADLLVTTTAGNIYITVTGYEI